MVCLLLAAGRPFSAPLGAVRPLAAASRRLSMVVEPAASRESASLIPTTLREMDADPEFQATAKQLREVGQQRLTLEERKNRRRALDALGVPDFEPFLAQRSLPAPRRDVVTTLQVNVGLYCNQACTHCHVESSPKRTETMDDATAQRVLELLAASPSVQTVDITGGAPEMNAAFRTLVAGARALGKEVIDRCNLTVLCEPDMEWLPAFLAEQRVRVVASLPCYSEKNVNAQRGNKVFSRSILALQALNALGYGAPGSELKLDLVYNPGGAFLPPPQESLREAYAERMRDDFGITFNELFTMTNMPIKRFADQLYKQGKLSEYMQLLVDNFNDETVPSTMCRSLVSVRWDGVMYDCDFNLALGVPLGANQPGVMGSIYDISSLDELEGAAVASSNHCFGCTAGMGSS